MAALPSRAQRAVVEVLRTQLRLDDRFVRAHDGALGNADGAGLVELPGPVCVLVVSTAGTLEPGSEPPLCAINYLALVIARMADRDQDKLSPGDVAQDLAWAIAALADGETWNATHSKVPENIRVRNEHTNGFARKGLAVWSVNWLQELELEEAGASNGGATLDELRSILFRFYGRDEERDPDTHAGDTPHHEALVEFDEDEADPEEEP